MTVLVYKTKQPIIIFKSKACVAKQKLESQKLKIDQFTMTKHKKCGQIKSLKR